MSENTRLVSPVPLATGSALWLAATALLLEDAARTGAWDVQHLAVPNLTASTCVAGVLAHKALAQLRLLSGAALVLLALLGSALCTLNTLGRTAADKDRQVAVAMAANRVLAERHGELTAARAAMAAECRVRGPRCKEWEQRVDALQRETAGMLALAVDPKADAIARLAVLVGLNGERAKAIVQAIEPAALPLFLELGAIILLGVAFPGRGRALQRNSASETAIVEQSFTREQALLDLQQLRQAGSGRYLAQRWGVDPATACRWLRSFEADGEIHRRRDGRCKVVALPGARSI